MMMVSSPKGQALIDAYDDLPTDEDPGEESLEAFFRAAIAIAEDLHEQGFRSGREGD